MACNEFCAQGAIHMAFVTMLFPLGGCHSESAITESLINFCHSIPVSNCATFNPSTCNLSHRQ